MNIKSQLISAETMEICDGTIPYNMK